MLRTIAASSASTISSTSSRTTDLLARYGGEEFAVLLRDCAPDEAVQILDELRAVTPLGQTFSAGVAQWDGQESPERLIGRADVGLYEAKRTGRDRIIVTPSQADASEPPDPTTAETAPQRHQIDTNTR